MLQGAAGPMSIVIGPPSIDALYLRPGKRELALHLQDAAFRTHGNQRALFRRGSVRRARQKFPEFLCHNSR